MSLSRSGADLVLRPTLLFGKTVQKVLTGKYLMLTSSNNQVSLSTKKSGAQGMVPPTGVGKVSSHLGVLQRVLVTRMRRDTLRQCALRRTPLRLP